MPDTKDVVYGVAMKNWAPKMWDTMYAVAFTSPVDPTPQQREKFRKWFELIATVIPCDKCKVHFEEVMRKHPVDTRSRASLSKWLVKAHNEVNRSLGKPDVIWEDAVLRNLPPNMRASVENDTVASTRPLDAVLVDPVEKCNVKWSGVQIAIVAVAAVLLVILIAVVIRMATKHSNPNG